MSLAAEEDVTKSRNVRHLNVDRIRKTIESAEVSSLESEVKVKVRSRSIEVHEGNMSSLHFEEQHQSDQTKVHHKNISANLTEDHNDPVAMANSTEEIPRVIAATSTSGNASDPVILHTLLDDEDMFVGSGEQENPPREAEGKELEPEMQEQEIQEPEVKEPEVKEDAQMSSEEELESNDEDGDSGDDDADDDDVYEVVENTSDILGYFKGKERTKTSEALVQACVTT